MEAVAADLEGPGAVRVPRNRKTKRCLLGIARFGDLVGYWVVDLADDANRVEVTFWDWRPTLRLIRAFGVIGDAERLGLMEHPGAFFEITEQEAREIGRRIEGEVLPNLAPQGRVLYDGSVTDEPDAGTFYREPGGVWRNYGATREWLEEFAEFCPRSRGFYVRP